MDPHIWPSKSRTTSSNIYTAAMWGIRDVSLKTCQRWWMIGRSGERGSGISVLVARHDDDDDDLLTFIVFNLDRVLIDVMLRYLFYKTPETMLKKSVLPSDEQTTAFLFLWSIIIVMPVSLGSPYTSCIHSIFSLCLESKFSDKFTENSVASRSFSTYPFNDSTDS